MEFIKEEIEEVTIKEEFRVKDEDTEEQIGPVEMNMESGVKTEIRSTGQYNDAHYLMTEQKPFNCSETSSQKSTQKTGRCFDCSECGRSFANKANLVRHLAVHDEKDPYTCKQCGNSFANKGNLTLHFRIHIGEKPYRCQQCGKSFKQKSTLKSHVKIHNRV